MTKLEESRRLVVRFSLYIEALGGVPAPYRGGSLWTYAVELQQQYERLRHQLGPEASRVARIAGRASMRKQGFAQAAAKFLPPSLLPAAQGRETGKSPEDPPTEQPANTAVTPDGPDSITKRGLYNCLRKLRHANFLSAMLHASRLNQHDLHIYPCLVCGGLHVGHDPSLTARRRRRINKDLRALKNRIEALDRERGFLLERERELRSELVAIVEDREPPDRDRLLCDDGTPEFCCSPRE